MRLSDVEEYATLARSAEGRLGDLRCTVPEGSTVRVIGQPVSLDDASPSTMHFVRVVDGPCGGFEATLDEGALRDFRASPQPPVAPPASTG